jgi:MFS family permease
VASAASAAPASARGAPASAAVAALAGALGAYGVSLAIIAVTTSLYLANVVHAGALAIGLFFAGRGAIGIVVSLAGGRLSDRMRDRRVPLALSGLAGALGAACFAVLHGYAAAFVAGAVLLNLGGVAFSQLFAYAREHAEARELGTTAFTSAIRSVFSASWVIGPPFGFYLLSRYGFRPLYLTAAGLFLFTALLGRWGGVPTCCSPRSSFSGWSTRYTASRRAVRHQGPAPGNVARRLARRAWRGAGNTGHDRRRPGCRSSRCSCSRPGPPSPRIPLPASRQAVYFPTLMIASSY